MSEQVYISKDAYLYLKEVQAQIYKEQGKKLGLNELASKAILNGVKE